MNKDSQAEEGKHRDAAGQMLGMDV